MTEWTGPLWLWRKELVLTAVENIVLIPAVCPDGSISDLSVLQQPRCEITCLVSCQSLKQQQDFGFSCCICVLVCVSGGGSHCLQQVPTGWSRSELQVHKLFNWILDSFWIQMSSAFGLNCLVERTFVLRLWTRPQPWGPWLALRGMWCHVLLAVLKILVYLCSSTFLRCSVTLLSAASGDDLSVWTPLLLLSASSSSAESKAPPSSSVHASGVWCHHMKLLNDLRAL